MIVVSNIDIKALTGAELAPFSVNIKMKSTDCATPATYYTAIGECSIPLKPWHVGLLSIFFVTSFYFMIALFRIYARKATGAEQFGEAKKKSILRRFDFIGPMGFFIIFVFIICWIWGLVLYAITDIAIFIVLGIFGSIAILAFTRGYVYFTINEYDYFEDVEKLNKKIDRHNKRIDEVEKKKAEIQQ
jgi:hypothetical protein